MICLLLTAFSGIAHAEPSHEKAHIVSENENCSLDDKHLKTAVKDWKEQELKDQIELYKASIARNEHSNEQSESLAYRLAYQQKRGGKDPESHKTYSKMTKKEYLEILKRETQQMKAELEIFETELKNRG